MRSLVRYFGVIFLQYMAVVAVFVVVVVLGSRYTPLSLFENYGYMLPSLGIWLTPMTLAGSHASTSLPMYFGVRRCRCFVGIQALAVGMSACTLALAAAGMYFIRKGVADYGMELSAGALPIILAASVLITEMALWVQYLPRGAGQRGVSVLMILILASLAAAITLGVMDALTLPVALFPATVLRPGWAVFAAVCAAAGVAVGALTWKWFRKAVIRL